VEAGGCGGGEEDGLEEEGPGGQSEFRRKKKIPMRRVCVEGRAQRPCGTYTLKMMALLITAPRKFENMRFARGEVPSRRRGIIGRAARDWVYRKTGKQTATVHSAVMTMGWFPAKNGMRLGCHDGQQSVNT